MQGSVEPFTLEMDLSRQIILQHILYHQRGGWYTLRGNHDVIVSEETLAGIPTEERLFEEGDAGPPVDVIIIRGVLFSPETRRQIQ